MTTTEYSAIAYTATGQGAQDYSKSAGALTFWAKDLNAVEEWAIEIMKKESIVHNVTIFYYEETGRSHVTVDRSSYCKEFPGHCVECTE